MARKRSSSAPSQRQLRVGENVRHCLSDLLRRGDVFGQQHDVSDITVAEVRMSPDLRHGTIYVSSLTGELDRERLKLLQHAGKQMAGHVTRAVNLKYAPVLRFERDEAQDYAARIDAILRDEKSRQQVSTDENPASDE